MSALNNKTSVLSVENFSAYFGQIKVVTDVTFEAKQNQVVALIGPSGCGKSTILRSVNRLHEETPGAWVQGNIFLNNQNIYSPDLDPVVVRSKIGMVFQKSNPFPGLSILENVVAGKLLANRFANKNEFLELAEQALRQAALWDEVKDVLKKPASSLSGGQQQRLCIARALAVNPLVLLMDEPTSALDPLSTAKVEELIIELKKSKTILIVTHNLQQAARISDCTGLMYAGEMVEFGETTTIFTNPKKLITENYITGRFG